MDAEPDVTVAWGGLSTPGRRVLVQLGAVWLLGTTLLTAAIPALAPLLFVGWGAVLVGLLVVVVLGAGLLWLIARSTASVTVLGARPGLWVLLVLAGGLALARLGWRWTDEVGLGVSSDATLTLLLGGVPFVLVAGLLLRGWRPRLAAGLALVGLLGVGLVALARSGPDEVTERLRYAAQDRRTAYVVEIPGYRPVDSAYGGALGAGEFAPADPSAVPPARYVNVIADPVVGDARGECGQPHLDAAPAAESCATEPGGAVYLRGVVEHGYQITRGDRGVVVLGSLAVDRDLLRRATRTLRPATVGDLPTEERPADLFVVDLPGYRAQPLGIPRGVGYGPADHTGGAASVRVGLSVTVAGQDPCVQAACTSEGAGLTYVRREDSHAYVLRRGDVDVGVTGGVSVGRELLRDAALSARPASEDELLRALPPPPDRDLLDRLRAWLQTVPAAATS
ncbi:hypothetical protein C7C45_03505 [Micromonospora arborensis]|uniref:Uncharacterized protein n=1 Tax=Micromonospora arborensis TaxID=2116518 RepID=A0A318NSX7_9ACTN|nr:hypothetical protein [Micromonospora arborensis]PYC74965.1 hypothetical protein C7C45_03505 [Micromonospora arborensis]